MVGHDFKVHGVFNDAMVTRTGREGMLTDHHSDKSNNTEIKRKRESISSEEVEDDRPETGVEGESTSNSTETTEEETVAQVSASHEANSRECQVDTSLTPSDASLKANADYDHQVSSVSIVVNECASVASRSMLGNRDSSPSASISPASSESESGEWNTTPLNTPLPTSGHEVRESLPDVQKVIRSNLQIVLGSDPTKSKLGLPSQKADSPSSESQEVLDPNPIKQENVAFNNVRQEVAGSGSIYRQVVVSSIPDSLESEQLGRGSNRNNQNSTGSDIQMDTSSSSDSDESLDSESNSSQDGVVGTNSNASSDPGSSDQSSNNQGDSGFKVAPLTLSSTLDSHQRVVGSNPSIPVLNSATVSSSSEEVSETGLDHNPSSPPTLPSSPLLFSPLSLLPPLSSSAPSLLSSSLSLSSSSSSSPLSISSSEESSESPSPPPSLSPLGGVDSSSESEEESPPGDSLSDASDLVPSSNSVVSSERLNPVKDSESTESNSVEIILETESLTVNPRFDYNSSESDRESDSGEVDSKRDSDSYELQSNRESVSAGVDSENESLNNPGHKSDSYDQDITSTESDSKANTNLNPDPRPNPSPLPDHKSLSDHKPLSHHKPLSDHSSSTSQEETLHSQDSVEIISTNDQDITSTESDSKASTNLNPDPRPNPSPLPDHKPLSDHNPLSDHSSSISQEETLHSHDSVETISTNANRNANYDISTEANPTIDYSTNLHSPGTDSDVSVDANPDTNIKIVEAGIESNTGVAMNVDSDISREANVKHVDGGKNTNLLANPDGSNTNSPDRSQYASSEKHLPTPPLRRRHPPRRRPYNFGFLGPIVHSHSDSPLSSARERLAIRLNNAPLNPTSHNFKSFIGNVDVGGPPQSSSEETK